MDVRKFNGTVTKFVDNFGFIDEDVFFRTEVVEGGSIKLHDQVYCECEYSSKLPFKWNALKIVVKNRSQPQQQQQPAATYLQHRMQQMLHQHQPIQQNSNLTANMNANLNTNLNATLAAAQQAAIPNLPEIRKLIEKAQQPQIQNFQNVQQNNQPQFNTRQVQNDFQQTPYGGQQQITYTSTPGSAFVSPVLPFNQPINVQQQQPTLPLSNLRPFQSNNQPSNYPKRDNRKDNRDNRDNRDRNRRDDRDNPRNRDNDKRDLRNDRRDRGDSRDRKPPIRESRDNSLRDRDRRNTESPSNSVTSSNNTNKPRRRYTPLNIPNHEILKSSINSYDIKRNYDASIHIPSDFKEVKMNNDFEFNFKSYYKPIQYRIVHPTPTTDSKDDADKKENDKKESNKKDSEKKDENKKEESDDIKKESVEDEKSNEKIVNKSTSESNDKLNDSKSSSTNKQEENDVKTDEHKVVDLSSIKIKKKSASSTPVTNKYAVKVLLLSFPSMADIYDRVIENDRDKDNYTSSGKAYFLHFNKVFSYLCLKNHNDGHSLIGGKFDPKLDGYINETEPNLTQTAVRCVLQQTGIDLSSCKKWKRICTFLYNRDNSPFSSADNVAFEHSEIFIPDIWSLLENQSRCIKNENKINLNNSTSDKTSTDMNSLDNSKIDCTNGGDSFSSLQVHPSNSVAELSSFNDSKMMDDSSLISNDVSATKLNSSNNQSIDAEDTTKDRFIDFSQLNDLKVPELRNRLETEFAFKAPPKLKKADLVAKLAEFLNSKNKSTEEDVSKVDTKIEQPLEEMDDSVSKEEEDESKQAMDTSQDDAPKAVVEEVAQTSDSSNSAKRKADEEIEQSTKKAKSSEETIKESKENTNKQLEAISSDGFIMAYGSSSNTLTVLNLYQALNHNKYDHFELQIVSELLREFLTYHFCNYIISTCYENRHLLKDQDDKKQSEDTSKDQIDNSYVLLAFSYFDSCHCGYVIADDLLKLLSCCGINFSKRTWTSIVGTNDRIRYRQFKEPTKIYKFMDVERRITNSTITANKQEISSSSGIVTNPLYQKNGNWYDIDKVIDQSEEDERLKAELKDNLKIKENQINNLQSALNESEAKQKKIALANKKQNEEICDYKRDKDRYKYKYEESLKLINSLSNNLTEFIKKHEDKPKEREKDKDKEKEIKDPKDKEKDQKEKDQKDKDSTNDHK